MPRSVTWILISVLAWGVLVDVGPCFAAEPLHVRIDQLVEAKASGPAAERSSDAEFLRRVSLDLAGRIPTAEQTRQFLADQAPEKRTKLVDGLLNGPDYPRRMAELFNVMLMERRAEGVVNPEWEKFLRTSFEANKPWDRMAREILAPDPDDEQTRGSAFFYTKRLEHYGQNPIDYPGLARDVGRLFLGMDLQCAQCHDHLFIDDYKQQDFQGLFAFIQNAQIRTGVAFPAVSEKATTEPVGFMSVFVKEPRKTGPRLPGGEEIAIPTFEKGDEWLKPPDRKKKEPGVLKFSTLRLLGEQLPRAENEAFTRNIVNRLWFAMMGRGLVDPLDMQHSENPPSHPEVFDLLAGEFAAHKFDIKWLLREIALSKTYQRSGLLPEGIETVPRESFRVFNEKPLSAEQLLWSMLRATGSPDDSPEKLAKRFAELRTEFVKMFGNVPQEPEVEFSPSVKAALFMSNNSTVLNLLMAEPGNLADRLSKIDDPAKVAEDLYLSVLTRVPTEDEKATVAEHLETHGGDRPKAVGQLAWALLSSTEFCLNH